MTRYLPFLIYLFVIAGHQTLTLELTSIFGATVNLAGIMVIMVAMFRSEMEALWFGFAAGLVVGTSQIPLMGWFAMSLALLGMVAYYIKESMNIESFYSRLVVLLIGLIVQNLFMALATNPEEFIHLAWSWALPSGIYSSLIAWMILLVRDGSLSPRSFRSIF
jgi:rod shape-determining protein MreD